MKTTQISQKNSTKAGSKLANNVQINNLFVIREESNPAVPIIASKTSAIKIGQKVSQKKVLQERSIEEGSLQFENRNFEFECESTHAQYSSDFEDDDQHSELQEHLNFDVSFCSHKSDSQELICHEAHCDHDSLIEEKGQDEYQGGKTDEKNCGNSINNRNDRVMVRNHFEFQTLVKRPNNQQDNFMDDGQVYLPSIDYESQVDQESFWQNDDEGDDCSSNSSLCFSSFSQQKENIPQTMTENLPEPQLKQMQSSESASHLTPCWEDLRSPLIELLLKFYNAEDSGAEFVDAIRNVIQVLHYWRQCGEIDPQNLQNFFIDMILQVLNEIKHKLLAKAIERLNLLNSHLKPDTDGAPSGPAVDSQNSLASELVKKYPECPMAFDQMVFSVARYFDIINMNSDKIEDLWLNLLDLIGIENQNKYTVFRKVHYQGFRNVILKDPLIAQVIREVDSYKDSGLACMNPAKFLEQIYDIRRNCHAQHESYDAFIRSGGQSPALRQLIEYIHDEEMNANQNMLSQNEEADYSLHQSEQDSSYFEDEEVKASVAYELVLEQPAPPQLS